MIVAIHATKTHVEIIINLISSSVISKQQYSKSNVVSSNYNLHSDSQLEEHISSYE